MRQLGRNLLCALATGFILFFFSERLFWTVWRPSDSIGDLTITWLAYSAIAYLFLATIHYSRATDFWPVFLAGAVYGWLVEGGLAYTLYGTQASAPFPFSISITGLSWHALISVTVGWWATAKALAARRRTALIWISIGVGVFWGLWGMFPRQETPPIYTPVPEFLANAAVLTLGLMAAWWVLIRARVQEFRPGWFGFVLCTTVIGLFYVQHVIALGVMPLVILPVLLAVALAPIYWRRGKKKAAATVSMLNGSCDDRCQVARLPILALIPLAATGAYAIAVGLRLDGRSIATVVYFVSGLAGSVLFLLAIIATVSLKRNDGEHSPYA